MQTTDKDLTGTLLNQQLKWFKTEHTLQS